MKYPGYTSGNIVLTEGNWYTFRVHNLVRLQDDAWYYVLQDINGLKHFLAAENYEGYGIKQGSDILCKIDKINCTGRIYLEPRHPYYTEGEIYNFETVNNLKSGDDSALLVKDIGGNIIEILTNEHPDTLVKGKNMVQCRVKSIKKGIPILELTR